MKVYELIEDYDDGYDGYETSINLYINQDDALTEQLQLEALNTNTCITYNIKERLVK